MCLCLRFNKKPSFTGCQRRNLVKYVYALNFDKLIIQNCKQCNNYTQCMIRDKENQMALRFRKYHEFVEQDNLKSV